MTVNRGNQSPGELWLASKAVGFLALLTGLLYLRAVFGEGISTYSVGEVTGRSWFIALLILSGTGGLIAAWWQPRWGGTIAILCAVLLAIMVYRSVAHRPLISSLVYSSPFFVAGILYLVAAWRSTSHEA